jgi:hypothetical protein
MEEQDILEKCTIGIIRKFWFRISINSIIEWNKQPSKNN